MNGEMMNGGSSIPINDTTELKVYDVNLNDDANENVREVNGVIEGGTNSVMLTCKAVTRAQSQSKTLTVSKSLDDIFFEQVVISQNSEQFGKLQKDDPNLVDLFKLASENRNGFFVNQSNGLLFKKITKNGIDEIFVLVLPDCKVRDVMKLAHNQLSHFGGLKTFQLLSRKFFFKDMKKRVLEYCLGCEACAKRRRVTKIDRIPIQRIAKPTQSFEVVAIDIFGPLYESSKKNKYVLGVFDLATGYVFAYPIKNQTANTICNELLKFVSIAGFPRVIISDNQSSNVSGLNQAVYNFLGIEMRTTSPYHSNSNGSIERFWGTLRKMLSHLSATKHSKMWDILLPYLLFAYSNMLSETSGYSPYELVFGHTCRNMLDIMYDRWTGVEDVELPKLSKSDSTFFQSLKENIKVAMESAMDNRTRQEGRYIEHYNEMAKEKSFKVNDLVMILQPSCGAKVLATWIGPCTVVKQVSDNSYLIYNPKDSSSRLLHANKL
jgi:hypothetical protein